MSNRVKMSDVAAAAGVSSMTVSRAFKTNASVDEKTRERILRIADELGYSFDSRASNLRSLRTDFVALTVPTINNPNFAESVNALSLELAGDGLQPLIGYDLYDSKVEEQVIEQLWRRRPEAVVLTGGVHSRRVRKLLNTASVPVVETWDLPVDPIAHVVGFSNAAAMALLVDHLVSRGRRRIAFIGGDFNEDSRGADRRRGYVTAMQGHDLDPSRLIPIGGPSTVANGSEAMERILEQHPDTDAVIGVFDYASFGALTECQRRGIKVPEDIAIGSFGATELASHAYPSITTVDPHCAEIGRRTGMLITDLLKSGDKDTGPIRIEIGPTLKIGASTTESYR